MWGLVSYLHSGDSHAHGSTTAIHEEHEGEDAHADHEGEDHHDHEEEDHK
jgi:ZIP family zinc transporter